MTLGEETLALMRRMKVEDRRTMTCIVQELIAAEARRRGWIKNGKAGKARAPLPGGGA